MQFDSDKKTISSLLSSKKQFSIPRFQREFSWENKELKEFFTDIVSGISITLEGNLQTKEYFWGSTLFIGDFLDVVDKNMEVVDGQQRITTITIFLSVLANKFLAEGQEGLATRVREYIEFNDNNNNPLMVLYNESPNPFFQRKVQRMDIQNANAISDEEKRIEYAYNYFDKELSEDSLRKSMGKLSDVSFDKFSYLDLLKIIRDQLLNSVIICLSTPDKCQANMIFEILNAKGKSLESIDLIKNQIFSIMKTETPSDEAKLNWKSINDNLCNRALISLSVFFRHYWLSCYSKKPESALYTEFKKKITPATEGRYNSFLLDMKKASEQYMKILSPQEIDYNNRVEYRCLIESFNNINKVFNILQTRIILLALYDCHFVKNTISLTMFKKAVDFIEKFHFAFNALCKQRTSSLEKLYYQFSIDIRNANSKADAHEKIEQLINALREKMPSYTMFEENFIQLSYTKKNSPTNMKCKYAIQKIGKYYQHTDVIPNDASIEHIMDEDENKSISLNIGNLLLLEQPINSSIPKNSSYSYKRSVYDTESKYKMVSEFLKNENSNAWEELHILSRAKNMARLFYTEIIGISTEFPQA